MIKVCFMPDKGMLYGSKTLTLLKKGYIFLEKHLNFFQKHHFSSPEWKINHTENINISPFSLHIYAHPLSIKTCSCVNVSFLLMSFFQSSPLNFLIIFLFISKTFPKFSPVPRWRHFSWDEPDGLAQKWIIHIFHTTKRKLLQQNGNFIQ